MRNGQKMWLLLLCLTLAVCVWHASAEDTASDAEAESVSLSTEYREVARNDRLTLYLREDMMAIIVESNANGQRLYSAVQNPDEMKDNAKWKGFYQSGVVLDYLSGTTMNPVQADLLNDKHVLTYDYGENGFTADVYFTELEIGFQLRLSLEEDGLFVHVPQESFIERGEQNKIAAFTLFPFLGYSYKGQDAGYMFIPDGQGALIELTDHKGVLTNAYEQPVYGENIGIRTTGFFKYDIAPENVVMPVFGMVHTQDEIGFLGIIEEGESGAMIRAYPNGVTTDFDWICARFSYRLNYAQPVMINDDGVTESGSSVQGTSITQPTDHQRVFDIRLHYQIVEGENANYCGLAEAYRAYLSERGAFDRAEKDADFTVQLDFLGLELEDNLIGRSKVVMSTFAEIEEILRELRSASEAEFMAVLKGWQENGVTAGYPLKEYKADASLGGNQGMEALKEAMEALDVQVVPETDFLLLNLDDNPMNKYDAFQKITGVRFRTPTYKKMYPYTYYVPPQISVESSQSLLSPLRDAGWKSVQLSGITSLVSDYKMDKLYHSADESMALYAAICEEYSRSMQLSLAGANAYLWPYASCLTDVPIADSQFLLSKESVPFLSIVLSGQIPHFAEYTNFQADERQFFLRLVEQGAFPSFILTMESPSLLVNTNSSNLYSTEYKLYREMILSWARELGSVYRSIRGASIVDHVISGSTRRVTWSNGTVVYLNFGNTPAVIDGVELDAMAYKVVAANE